MIGLFKSALLGSKIRMLFTLVLSLGLVVAGGFTMGFLGTPSVVGVQNQFGTVTDETTEIRSDLVVNNPNPVGVSLGDVTVSYNVSMNDVKMADGTKEGVSVGSGNSTVEFTSRMQNERIPAWWASHVRNGEQTTVEVDTTVHSGTFDRSFAAPPVEREVETDVISQFNSSETRPINASQPFVSDPVAYVNETGAQWGEVTDARTPIDMQFVVYNPKTTPLAVSEIGYTITMNNVTVGNGSSERGHVIEGRSTETIRTETAIQNQKLDEWWVSHLENEQVTDLRIDFYAKMEFGGQTFRVPLDEMTYTKTIETDIFGTKNQSTDAGDAGGEETTSGDETAGGDDETATEGETTSETGTTEDEDATESGETTTEGDETSTEDETTETTADSEETTTDDGGVLARGMGGIR